MAQDCLARVIPSMHVHLCVALWLFLFTRLSFSTSFSCSSSGLSRCLPQSSTRGSGPTPCATSAWGPWPLLTTRHPSQFRKTMIELGRSEEVILEMDRVASEDHSHIATEEEIDVYRGNWWTRSNLVAFRHDGDKAST